MKLDDRAKTNPIKLQMEGTNSPKPFILLLEDIFEKLKWNTKGVNIEGVYLNHLLMI